MPPELDQPVAVISPEAAISALLCLFHQYAMHELDGQSCQRLSQRIFLHLEDMARRGDLPELLRRTCDELSDAWLLVLDLRQLPDRAGQP